MNPLSFNRKWLVWFSVYPVDNDELWKKRVTRLGVTIISILSNISVMISCVVFIRKYLSTDLVSVLYAFAIFIAFLGCSYIVFIALFQRGKIKEIFSSLAQIYDSNKNSESFDVLQQADNKCNSVCQFYVNYIIRVSIASIIGSSICSLVFSYFWFGGFNRDILYIPYTFIFPWNQNTLIGYLGEIIFSAMVATTYLYSVGSILLLFISICMHHAAFYKMFQHLTRQLDSQSNNVEGSLQDLVRFYISVKDWFWQTAAVYSLIIMVMLLYSMMLLAIEVFQLDLALKNITVDFSIYMISAILSASNLWLYCYFGRLITGSYGKMSDALYETNWHEMPIRLQKHYVLMIGNMQRPVEYRGFGIIVLNLETFCSLIRAVYTYYMLFKTITAE